MQTNNGFFCHRIFLVTLFILGNSIITIPLSKNENYGVIGFFIASAIGLLLAALVSLITKKLTDKNIHSTIKRALYGFGLICLLLILFDCCRDYVVFTDTTKIPNSSALLIAFAFLALSFYCGYQRSAVLYRAALVCFFICLLILIILAIFSLPRISLNGVDISYSRKGLKELLIKAFLPSAAVYYFVSDNKKGTCVSILGTFFGSIFLLLLGALCIFVLGKANNLIDYPLATVGGIISIGKGFMRFEGFVYLVIMLTSFIKASVIIHLILNILKPRRFTRP